ncbi:glycosyltransferase family 2 protein [Moheibacter stercoris]|uniref:Glycosyltransferase involved in cell wall biosynthesis n=1 Tax=Moheibacter stercoris TaxID=1628251 RepID=A0ABV2LWB1_9FLAO
MQPLVSVNIPVFKCEDFIVRCLDSVKNQTYQNLEIILVNDCTPDNSVVLIEKYQTKHPDLNLVLYHNETNQGLSVVRNKAIEKSTGKYIYMLDSDDFITPNCIEELVKISEESQSDITVGETICWDSKDGKEKILFPIRASGNSIEGNDLIFERFIEGDWPIIGPNKLYNREWILTNNLKFIPGLYSQDELWAFHCAFKLNKISFYKKKTYIYYLHGASTIFNKKKINFENHQTIVEWFTKAYNETTPFRQKLIKKKLINFKETSLQMQWRSLRDDVTYWKQNYKRLKKAPKLTFLDYFSSDFDIQLKKKNFLQNLPTELGYRLFKWRYER